MCGSAPGHPDFFSLSTRRPYSTRSSCYARGTCGRSQCLRLPEGREEKPQPGGKRRAAWDTPAATPISDVAVHTSDARISTTPRAHPHTHNEISLYTARVGNPTNIPLYSLISSIANSEQVKLYILNSGRGRILYYVAWVSSPSVASYRSTCTCAHRLLAPGSTYY